MTRNLETERYLLLIEQLVPEEGSREAAAKRVGASESYPIKLRGEPWRNVGIDKLRAAKERMRLRSAFFEDASLGDSPDYHDFVIGSRVDRDDVFPELERYREDMERAGTPIAPDHFEKLRTWRRATGPAEREEIIGYHRGMVAAAARKTLDRPIVEAQIEADRGQRQLPSKGKKRAGR